MYLRVCVHVCVCARVFLCVAHARRCQYASCIHGTGLCSCECVCGVCVHVFACVCVFVRTRACVAHTCHCQHASLVSMAQVVDLEKKASTQLEKLTLQTSDDWDARLRCGCGCGCVCGCVRVCLRVQVYFWCVCECVYVWMGEWV